MTPKGVIEYFGMDIEEFKEEARGLNGYRKQYTYRVNGNNGLIRVLYDGQMGMGVHVDVSGSAIHHFFEAFENKLTCDTPFGEKALQLPDDFDFQNKENIVVLLLAYIRRIAKFTRIDVALDDFASFFTLGEINALVENKQMVTKFRTYKRVVESSVSDSTIKGETIYVGSNKSDAFIRIYNKALEQKWMIWIGFAGKSSCVTLVQKLLLICFCQMNLSLFRLLLPLFLCWLAFFASLNWIMQTVLAVLPVKNGWSLSL